MRISSYYGNSESSRSNAKVISDNGCDIYFSYETPIAVSINGKLHISENIWGPTTGKHLNAINDDKKIRIPYEDIEKLIKGVKVITRDNEPQHFI